MWAFIGISWFAAAVCGGAAAFWVGAFLRVQRMMRSKPTVREGLKLPTPEGGWPRLSIVVPAHNEQRVIDDCCASLRAQNYENLQIVFVLDRCTDATLAIVQKHAAEDDRIVIIENDTCPDDWAGKCNAARRGAAAADGEMILFTDADTAFEPDLCRASVALALERDLGLLSLLSTLTCGHAYERIAQPVASINLIKMYPMERVNRPEGARPFANGQFLLFTRTVYENAGGHEAVKEALLEDIAFARRVNKTGGNVGVVLADGMLRCSMYDSLESFKNGWRRIFIEACKRKPDRMRQTAWRVLGLGVLLPLLQVLALGLGLGAMALGDYPLGTVLLLLVGIGWVAQGLTLVRVYPMTGAPASAIVFYPLGSWIVARVLRAGARDLEQRRPVKWGGREYILDPR